MILDKNTIEALRQKIKKNLELDNVDIPNDIKISTMTLDAKLNTEFYPWNIYKYIRKSSNGIIKVIKSDDDKNHPLNNRKNHSLNNRKNGSDAKDSVNQVTLAINASQKENPVSVKVFGNGRLHFTGCICIDSLIEVTYKLFVECSKCRAIITKNKKIKEIYFAKDISELRLDRLHNFKIDMINCNFTVPFRIDRPKLRVLFKSDGYNAMYDSNGHPGVRLKYVSVGKKITIFIFEPGSVIVIMGNQGLKRINEVYTFVYKYLLSNYDIIVKDDECINSSIMKFLEKDKKTDTNNDDFIDDQNLNAFVY